MHQMLLVVLGMSETALSDRESLRTKVGKTDMIDCSDSGSPFIQSSLVLVTLFDSP